MLLPFFYLKKVSLATNIFLSKLVLEVLLIWDRTKAIVGLTTMALEYDFAIIGENITPTKTSNITRVLCIFLLYTQRGLISH